MSMNHCDNLYNRNIIEASERQCEVSTNRNLIEFFASTNFTIASTSFLDIFNILEVLLMYQPIKSTESLKRARVANGLSVSCLYLQISYNKKRPFSKGLYRARLRYCDTLTLRLTDFHIFA